MSVDVDVLEAVVRVTDQLNRVHVVKVGFTGPQGPPGTLIEVSEGGSIIVTPLRELNFLDGFDVEETSPRHAAISLDLTEDANFVAVSTAVTEHVDEDADAHDASAVSFDPSGIGLSSTNVQDIIEELVVEAGGFTVDGTGEETSHTTDTSRWNGKAGDGRKVIVWDEDAGRPAWAYLTAVDVFEPASVLSLSVAPVGSYPDGVSGLAMVASSGTDTPRFAATYQGTPTDADVDILSHTYGGGRAPEVSGSDYPFAISTPFATGDGAAINRGRVVGESVTFRETATVDDTTQTRDVTLTYVNERLWGVSSVDIDTSGEIDTFRSAQSKELSNARAKSFAVTAGASEHIYYILRAALGTPVFTVGGFEGGFELFGSVSWTNPRGFAETFDVWRSENVNLGATTVVVT